MRTYPLWLLLGCLICSGPASVRAAADDKPIHAMIVFDVSGSMRQSDPERLSVAAAQLFSDLARATDAVGLATFSGTAESLVPVTAQKNSIIKAILQAQLQGLRFTGATTNLVAALEAGLAAFPQAEVPVHRNIVLLLTDGQLDLGKHREAEEALALAQIKDTLIPEYHRRGIKLYTIAFTPAADHVLLKQMADASDGEFRFIANAAMLHEAFGRMFIGGHQAESFPLEQNSMLVDSSIQDLSLVFEKETPDERIALVTPGNETLRSTDASSGAVWRSTPTYDVVSFKKPQAGRWSIERSGSTQKGVGIIASSTLSLEVEFGSAPLETGTKASLRAFLLDKSSSGNRIQREAQGTMTAEISTPAGETSHLVLEPHSDGSFFGATPLLQAPGKYSVTVTASTPTLKRQRSTTLSVRPRSTPAEEPRPVPPAPVEPPSPADPKVQPEAVANVVNKVLYFNVLLALIGAIGYGSYRFGVRNAKVGYGRNPSLDSDNDRRDPAAR